MGILCLLSTATPVYSQTVPDTCDADYYDVLRARTYAEGKRQVELTQRLILKPDSVLEYSCFNEAALHLGFAGASFSERGLALGEGTPPEFDGAPAHIRIYPNSLEDALERVVQSSLVGFLQSFSHIYGGGTFTWVPNPLAGCNPMNVVWHVLKCSDFNQNIWIRFEDLASDDIRFFPIPCDNPTRESRIDAALAASYPVPASPAASGGMDLYRGFVPELTGSCAAAGSSSIPGGGNSPLLTGVTTTMTDGSTVEEAVCMQPGCHFDGSACIN